MYGITLASVMTINHPLYFLLLLLLNFTTGSCKIINCPNGKQCIEDQNFQPQCINCPKCSQKNRTLDLKKLVCGVDGITYRSMCELRQKSCKIGKSIQPAYRGPCTGNKKYIFFIAFLCFQIIFGNQAVDKKKNRLISILIDSIVATMSLL